MIIIASFMPRTGQDKSRLRAWARYWIRRCRSLEYDVSSRDQKHYIQISFDDCGGILLFLVSHAFLQHYFMNENI